jgi:hypothetical protein
MGPTPVNKMELDCAKIRKWDAFYPLSKDFVDIGPLRAAPILNAVREAIAGSQTNLIRVMAVQPLAFRLLNEQKNKQQ